MARQLWLLRHAEAEPHGTRADAERRLTERGERQARAAGLALAGIGAEFDGVLVSPKVRARQTAELAGEQWEAGLRDLLRIHEPLAGGFDAAAALDAFAEAGGARRLLLVGHEPDFTGVIGALTGAAADLKKGGLAGLRLDGARAELMLLMRPSELALIAGQAHLSV